MNLAIEVVRSTRYRDFPPVLPPLALRLGGGCMLHDVVLGVLVAMVCLGSPFDAILCFGTINQLPVLVVELEVAL